MVLLITKIDTHSVSTNPRRRSITSQYTSLTSTVFNTSPDTISTSIHSNYTISSEVTPAHCSDSRFYLPDESPFVPRSYITTTHGPTTPSPVTTDFMESLDRTRSLLSEQRDQELARQRREWQRKNKEALQSLRDVSQSQQQLGQILQRMAANPSRQGTPITPTPAPLASPIHHPTLVPASPVSSAATVQQVQAPEVISHTIVHISDKEYVELRYLQNQGREYFDYLGNNQVGKMRSSDYVFAE